MAQWRTVPAVQGSSSPAIHKELHYTRSLHNLPELAISVCSLYLNHSETWPSSYPRPYTVCLLFHLWSMPGPQTFNLPLCHEAASGLWCHLAGYMPGSELWRKIFLEAADAACLCLLYSQECCLRAEEGLQKQSSSVQSLQCKGLLMSFELNLLCGL